MLLDEEEGFLIIENRNAQEHKTKFAAIDIENKKLLWRDLEFKEDWWIGMSFIKTGNILFHIYENDQNPEPSSYFLYSVTDQSIIWESSDIRVSSLTKEGILGYIEVNDTNQLVLLNPFTGKIKNISPKEYLVNISDTAGKLENKNSYYPFHYLEETDYFISVKRYLEQDHGVNPVKAIDYLEIGGAIIISYYLYNKSQKDNLKLINYLMILNKEGNQLLNEKIDESETGVGIGTFFVIKNQLIFLKNKSEIISYQIDIYE